MATLHSLFSNAPRREAQELYIALVSQSRNAFFYTDCAVPDTLDGRFEIILLHLFLFMHSSPERRRQRLLLECLFDDMDRSLREMGVGDMGVGKRVKTMAKAAFGRLEAYTRDFGSDEKLRAALGRNVYRGAEAPEAAVDALLDYIRRYEPNR
jgi:cytochrome b pre-mRNA-processing protein 3